MSSSKLAVWVQEKAFLLKNTRKSRNGNGITNLFIDLFIKKHPPQKELEPV
jgi:hypothetical protein